MGTLIQKIRQHIAAAELSKALLLLRSFLQNTPQFNEAIQQSARYEALCQQVRLGQVAHETATLTQNQISYGVLELLSTLEESKEHEKYFLSPHSRDGITSSDSCFLSFRKG